ncbi:MAG: hypothetical protein IJA62_05525 [Ruminococcus sp.]|nr:hypothetical protein [Ruminococcus sp.]
MYKNIFDDFDKIKAPKSLVEKVVKKAAEAKEDENVKEFKKVNGRFAFGVLAACLAVVFTITAVVGLGAKPSPVQGEKSRFIITANAKQVELLGDKADQSTIGAYSEELTGGWAMYPNLEKYEDASPNFFQSFALSMFEIEGEDIVSVTFKANSEGVYFALSPAGYFQGEDRELLSNYSEMSLENSQYTPEELKEYGDGLSYGKTYCDTFTFISTDVSGEGSDKIDFSKKLELVLESNRSNAQMAEKLDRLWECEQKLLKLRENHTFEGGELSEEEEALWAESDVLSQQIRKLILQDSTIDVAVTFKDGTTEKKVLRADLVNTDDQRMWLTISEE